jgi:hypothetical protein
MKNIIEQLQENQNKNQSVSDLSLFNEVYFDEDVSKGNQKQIYYDVTEDGIKRGFLSAYKRADGVWEWSAEIDDGFGEIHYKQGVTSDSKLKRAMTWVEDVLSFKRLR